MQAKAGRTHLTTALGTLPSVVASPNRERSVERLVLSRSPVKYYIPEGPRPSTNLTAVHRYF